MILFIEFGERFNNFIQWKIKILLDFTWIVEFSKRIIFCFMIFDVILLTRPNKNAQTDQIIIGEHSAIGIIYY